MLLYCYNCDSRKLNFMFGCAVIQITDDASNLLAAQDSLSQAGNETRETPEPPLKKFLAANQRATEVAARPAHVDTATVEMSKYLIEIRNTSCVSDPIVFWQQRLPVYPRLALLAQDLISAPASQAFVERIFSLCGMLTTGRRNRMEKSLEMRVFLRLNSHLL